MKPEVKPKKVAQPKAADGGKVATALSPYSAASKRKGKA